MIHDDSLPTRRGILLFAASLPLFAADAEFWNRKAPSQWSSDEVDRLITKSPWAKEITPAAPQSGAGRGRAGRGSPTGGAGSAPYRGIVRWESAKPVLEAMKADLPGEFANHYVISVSGIPSSSSRSLPNAEQTDAESRASQRESEGVLERIKGLTYLESIGARSTQPGIVEETPFGVGETRTLLFGFSKALLPLSLDNKEVSFTTQIGGTQVKAKYILKEMMYHDELAI